MAAYKSLMASCALEQRSFELSNESLIQTHSRLYRVPHSRAGERRTVCGASTLVKMSSGVDEPNVHDDALTDLQEEGLD